MKTAFPYWENRIAPVFDTARQLHLVESEAGRIVAETQATLPEDLPVQKTLTLVALGITTLVCGAISRPMHELILAYGIKVVPFVAGDLSEVIQAWLHDNLAQTTFAMPGCRSRRRQGNQKLGRMTLSPAAGPIGYCVCPQCGQREPHKRGVPCIACKCPKCGSTMTRQSQ
ncbi:MAG: NifB/NifX family molybdenum-iron cluster-binding protein [Desulfobacterales bacterium]|nr:NifB/NifX family molybdenum-iron cluster-binding protein [Desulfobacterales bacterium]